MSFETIFNHLAYCSLEQIVFNCFKLFTKISLGVAPSWDYQALSENLSPKLVY